MIMGTKTDSVFLYIHEIVIKFCMSNDSFKYYFYMYDDVVQYSVAS
jgi:hypothetical protein